MCAIPILSRQLLTQTLSSTKGESTPPSSESGPEVTLNRAGVFAVVAEGSVEPLFISADVEESEAYAKAKAYVDSFFLSGGRLTLQIIRLRLTP